MRKLINALKHRAPIPNNYFTFTDVLRNINQITHISNRNNDDRLLNLIYDKYPEIFDKLFISNHDLPINFRDKCLKNIIYDEIKNNVQLVYHDLARKFVSFYQIAYDVLFEKFDSPFIINYIEQIKFSKFSYHFIKNTAEPIKNYINAFVLLKPDSITLNKYILQACYDLTDKTKRKEFREAIIGAYEKELTLKTKTQMKMMINDDNFAVCYDSQGGFLEVKKPEPPQPPQQINNPAINHWTRNIGHAIIDHVDFQIGGSSIDRQYSTWLDLWQEMTSK
jgi:hypothetical protein